MLYAKLIESPHYDEILNHLHLAPFTKTLVLTDIDNTIMHAASHLGSCEWGEHLLQDLMKKGVSENEAQSIEGILWKTVQPHIPIQLVDPKTPDIISGLQRLGIQVLGLTARAPHDSDYTHKQLKSLGIDLSKFKAIRTELDLQHPALFEDGIIFANSYNKKSEALITFMQQHNFYPDFVIYIDDRLHHLHDVTEVLKPLGINCIGIRLSQADAKANEFQAEIADMQWKAFPKLISDSEARKMLSEYIQANPLEQN